MSELYNLLRTRADMKPMAALRWLHGPEPLPASRMPNFMDYRRGLLAERQRDEQPPGDGRRREDPAAR